MKKEKEYNNFYEMDEYNYNKWGIPYSNDSITTPPLIKVVRLSDVGDIIYEPPMEEIKQIKSSSSIQSPTWNKRGEKKNNLLGLDDKSFITSSYELPIINKKQSEEDKVTSATKVAGKENSMIETSNYFITSVLPKNTPLDRLIPINDDKSDYSRSFINAHRKGLAYSFQKDQNFSTFCHYLKLLCAKKKNKIKKGVHVKRGDNIISSYNHSHDDNDDNDNDDDESNSYSSYSSSDSSSDYDSVSSSSFNNSNNTISLQKKKHKHKHCAASSIIYIQKRDASTILDELLSSVDITTKRYLAQIIYDRYGKDLLNKCWVIFPNEITRDIVNSRSHLLFDSSHSSTPIGFYVCSDICVSMPKSFCSVSGVVYSSDLFSNITDYAKELGANLYNLDVDYSSYIDNYQYTEATQSEEEDTFTNLFV